jgi:hypothetical protein
MRIIQARLDGVDAQLGRVSAADVARVVLGTERAMRRAAYVVLGRPRRGSGRHNAAIESAARLRFVGVEQGSIVGLLALPDAVDTADGELPIPVADLSSSAVRTLLDAIGAPTTDADLAAAIAQMAADLGIGDRNTSISLTDMSAGSMRHCARVRDSRGRSGITHEASKPRASSCGRSSEARSSRSTTGRSGT